MPSPATLRRAATATVSTLTLLLAVPTAALAGGSTAQVDVEHDCTSVAVTSSKDISNVVLAFTDGDRQKHDGLSGRSGSFRGTGANADQVITTAWVKSGNNKSGDGPGYGERFDFATEGCDTSAEDDGYPTGGSTQPTDEEAGRDDAPDEGASEDARPQSASTASIEVQGTCDAVRVTSSKDISNVVLAYTDGTHEKFDGLSGRSGTFDATGDRTITTVWVKSGANHSGDGPGYGERFDLATGDCRTAGPTSDLDSSDENPSSDPTGDGATGNDATGDDATREDEGNDTNGDDAGDGPAVDDGDTGEGDVLGTDRSSSNHTGTDAVPSAGSSNTTTAQEGPEVLGVALDRTTAPAADNDLTTADGSGIAASNLPNTGANGVPAALAAAIAALLLGAGLVRRSRVA